MFSFSPERASYLSTEIVLNPCTWSNEPSDRVCAHRPMTEFERTSLTPAEDGATAGEGLKSCFQQRAALGLS